MKISTYLSLLGGAYAELLPHGKFLVYNILYIIINIKHFFCINNNFLKCFSLFIIQILIGKKQGDSMKSIEINEQGLQKVPLSKSANIFGMSVDSLWVCSFNHIIMKKIYTPRAFFCMFDFKIHAKKANMQKKEWKKGRWGVILLKV